MRVGSQLSLLEDLGRKTEARDTHTLEAKSELEGMRDRKSPIAIAQLSLGPRRPPVRRLRAAAVGTVPEESCIVFRHGSAFSR